MALWFLASFVVVPTLAVSAGNPNFGDTTKLMASTSAVLGFVVLAPLVRVKPVPDKSLTMRRGGVLSEPNFVLLILVLTFASIVTIVIGYGMRTFDLSFATQYDRRLAVRDLPDPYPGSNYLMAWLQMPLMPFLVIMGIQWRRKWLLVMAGACSILIFGFDGQKIVLVIPVLAVAVLYSMRRASSGSSLPILGLLLTFGALLIPTLTYYVIPNLHLDLWLSRRFGLDPGMLTHQYAAYASTYGFTHFSQSWARPFMTTQNTDSLGLRVGQMLDPGSASNSNANLWADGYASWGFLGVVIASLILVVTLWVFDYLAMTRAPMVAAATLGTVTFYYVNGTTHSSLLTGGVLFTIVLTLLMPTGQSPTVSNSQNLLVEPNKPRF